MPYLCNLVYLVLLAVCSPWLLWGAARQGKYREGWRQKLWGLVPRAAHLADAPPQTGMTGQGGGAPRVWLHAVSVGEVQLLAVLIRELRARRPDLCFVITVTTKTGYDLACRRFEGDTVCYCPLDFSWAVSRALRRIQPDLLILVELELWPNLIAAAKRQGVPIAIVNGRLSEQSFRGYRRFRPLLRKTFGRLDLVAVQTDEYADRFRELGVASPRIRVTGSLKFDGVQTDRGNSSTLGLAELAGIDEDAVVFLAGSTQAPEEVFAVETYQQLSANYPQLRLILVPRHPHRFDEVAGMLDRRGVQWERRTALPDRGRSPAVILVDTVGELGAWWGTAELAFVGGSLGSRGGQNMMEPAGYGVALSFGPNTKNFRDVVDGLLKRDAAVVVRDQQELTDFVRRGLASSEWRQSLGQRARDFVSEQRGAGARTADELLRLLPDAGARRQTAA